MDIFCTTPIAKLQDRIIRLCEFRATGSEITDALRRRHGKAPEIFRQSLAAVEQEIDARLAKGDMTAVALSYRHPWGEGTNNKYNPEDVWTVKDYPKTTLDEVVVQGQLGSYKDLPSKLAEGLESTFISK